MTKEPEAALVACQRHQREGCPMCLSPIVLDESAAPAAWKPFDAAVWLLNGRWSPVNGWSVVSTPEVWAGTVLLNGTHYRVTVEPVSEAGEQRG